MFFENLSCVNVSQIKNRNSCRYNIYITTCLLFVNI